MARTNVLLDTAREDHPGGLSMQPARAWFVPGAKQLRDLPAHVLAKLRRTARPSQAGGGVAHEASGSRAGTPPRAPINKLEKGARYLNDVAIHLIGSDLPALASIVANLVDLPRWAAPLLGWFNAINSVTGWVSIALDGRETVGCLRNPQSTRTDKLVDVVHLLAGDGISTAASMVPFFAALTNPVALGLFVGGQVLGLGLDLAKTVYDIKRQGQQSAR
jgi:hypothetical protein